MTHKQVNASGQPGARLQHRGARGRGMAFFRSSWGVHILLALFLVESGCSLIAMGGRMLLGDTKEKSQFKKATHTDLVRDKGKVLVLCSATDSARANYPSVEFDVLDGVACRLRVAGIKMVNPGDVAEWLDDHGGDLGELPKLAKRFKADYVIHIEVTSFDCREENSPDLLRGRSEGRVRTYHVVTTESAPQLQEVMNSDFVSLYPPGNPVSVNQKSAKNFTQDYLSRLSLQLAQMFYDHPVAEEIL
jgi:hypothetical protein